MLIKWSLVFLFSLPAWGYNLTQDFVNGFYWATLPISLVVIDDNSTRKNEITELAQDAIGEWENRTGLSLWDLTGGGTSNIIRWSTNFASETRMDPTSVLAIAIRYTNGPYFAKTEIIINGEHNSFNTGNKNIDMMNLGTTMVHELGHTVGLDHSENMMAVMAPTLQYPYNGLHSDDLHGIEDAHAQTQHRQMTKYISPLSYTKVDQSPQPLSCATTSQVGAGGNGLLSLASGILIGLVRNLFRWVKSLF